MKKKGFKKNLDQIDKKNKLTEINLILISNKGCTYEKTGSK